MHMYTACPYQLHQVPRNSVKRFRGSGLTNYFSSTFNFGKKISSKRGITRQKKNEWEFPANMHIYKVWLSIHVQFPLLNRYCQHRNVDDVDTISSLHCHHRSHFPFVDILDIVDIVDIAMYFWRNRWQV